MLPIDSLRKLFPDKTDEQLKTLQRIYTQPDEDDDDDDLISDDEDDEDDNEEYDHVDETPAAHVEPAELSAAIHRAHLQEESEFENQPLTGLDQNPPLLQISFGDGRKTSVGNPMSPQVMSPQMMSPQMMSPQMMSPQMMTPVRSTGLRTPVGGLGVSASGQLRPMSPLGPGTPMTPMTPMSREMTGEDGSRFRVRKNPQQAEKEMVEGYRFSTMLQYPAGSGLKYSNSLVNREQKMLAMRKQSSDSVVVINPLRAKRSSTIRHRSPLKRVAESFIKAYRMSKTLAFAIGDAVERMSIGSRSVVTRGSILGLAAYLIRMNQELDLLFLQEFLITHPLYMTSTQLLKILVSFYARHTTTAQDDDVIESAKTFVQVRVLDILEIWLTRHPQHFAKGTPTHLALTGFLQDHMSDYEIIGSVIESLNTAEKAVAPKIGFPRDAKPGKTIHFPSKFEPEAFAKHLTDVELNMFRGVPVSDLIGYLRNPTSEANKELAYFERWSERLSIWMASNICNPTFAKDRGAMITYFIKAAHHCLLLNNYNGVFQVMKAFMTSPVRRLKKSWNSVNAEDKRIFEELKEITSPVDNYENYRTRLKNTSETVFPSIHVYLHDLVSIFHLHDDWTEDSRVNFYKFHLIGSILDNIYCCQQQEMKAFPRIKELDDLMVEIANSTMSKKELTEISLDREPSDNQAGEIFGSPLADLVAKTGVPSDKANGMIPAFVRDLLQFLRSEDRLKTQGLFRMSGNKLVIEKIKEESDKIGNLWIPETGMSPHDATGLLKVFLSSLPDSVFTSALHKTFVKVAELPSRKEQLEGIKLNISLLPAVNRHLLFTLLEFCNEVIALGHSNKMDRYNLSVIFSPTLFSRKKAWLQMKEKFFNMQGMVDTKSLVKQQHEQDLLRPLMELMLAQYSELASSAAMDLPHITAVYHQTYGTPSLRESSKTLKGSLSSISDRKSQTSLSEKS